MINSDFEAPPWLKSKHRQTSFHAMHRRVLAPVRRHERWITPDDDFLDLYFIELDRARPWVLLLHGLEDNVDTPYVAGFQRALAQAEFNVVVMEFRSCGQELNRAPRLYHMGETSDLDFVAERLAKRVAPAPLHLLGCSLGANVVLKWLAERGDCLPKNLASAAALAAPYDPTIGAANIHRQLGGLYMKAFLNSLMPKAVAKEAQYPGLLNLDAVRACRHFWDFDTHVTAPLHGYADADDYWRKVAGRNWLAHIRLPTLLLSAEDDPFNPAETLPVAESAESAWLHPVFTPEGGHLGWVYGDSPEQARYWAEEKVVEFFKQAP